MKTAALIILCLAPPCGAAILLNGDLIEDPLIISEPFVSAPNIVADGESAVTVLAGGNFKGTFSGNSSLTMNDGSANITMTGESEFEMRGGVGNFVSLTGNSTSLVSDGRFNGALRVLEDSFAKFSGGQTSQNDFEIRDRANVTIAGGSWFTTFTGGNANLDIEGGLLHAEVIFQDDSTGTIRSGTFGDSISMGDRTEFTLFASEANFTGDFFAENRTADQESVLGRSLQRVGGTITGTYLDGSPIEIRLSVDHDAILHISSVPEPSSVTMIALGAIIVIAQRRRNCERVYS